LKINHYKAPRDKLICILNCCKVIFGLPSATLSALWLLTYLPLQCITGLIRHLQKEEGADAFVPILIFVVLKANPEHLLSNVE
jgi:Rab5 GDP/GTP exchange factor